MPQLSRDVKFVIAFMVAAIIGLILFSTLHKLTSDPPMSADLRRMKMHSLELERIRQPRLTEQCTKGEVQACVDLEKSKEKVKEIEKELGQ